MAPGEADQQLAYLYYHGWVDAVISSDSDMLVYNVPLFCPDRRDARDPMLNGTFYEPGTFARLAERNRMSVEDYFVKLLLNNGCDYFLSS